MTGPGREEMEKRAVAHITQWGGSQTAGSMLVAFAEAEIARLATKPDDLFARHRATQEVLQAPMTEQADRAGLDGLRATIFGDSSFTLEDGMILEFKGRTLTQIWRRLFDKAVSAAPLEQIHPNPALPGTALVP